MSVLETARHNMRELAADLEALRPHLQTPGAEVVGLAWASARAAFLRAVEDYLTAIGDA